MVEHVHRLLLYESDIILLCGSLKKLAIKKAENSGEPSELNLNLINVSAAQGRQKSILPNTLDVPAESILARFDSSEENL